MNPQAPSESRKDLIHPEEPPTPLIESPKPRGLANHRATGPRTLVGRQRASRNATKHALLSKVAVLPNESQAEYDELLKALREAHRPEGAQEGLLVEKLATIAWRHRRLLSAEAAEIRKSQESVEWHERAREREQSETIEKVWDSPDDQVLWKKISHPDVLERNLKLLSELRKRIEKNGFDPDYDSGILEKIYGPRNKSNSSYGIITMYNDIVNIFNRVSKGTPPGFEFVSPAKCIEYFLEDIKLEMVGLKLSSMVRTIVYRAPTQLEILARGVPDFPALDRLLRYEASLERNFDRTLNQLERLQRMRKGQPVPAPLNVNLSAS